MLLLALALQLSSVAASCAKDDFQPVNEIDIFSLPKLPYAYNALNPYYWDQLLYFHHDEVHRSLIPSLNSLISSNKAKYSHTNLTSLLQQYGKTDYDLWKYAGGHYNHCLFWWIMTPFKCAASAPTGQLLLDINKQWGSFEKFKTEFGNTAKGLFGSGWIWLCKDQESKLVIKAKSEEFSPLAEGLIPFMGIDMWEHAYYFYYMWDRGAYVDNWWSVVDWGLVVYFYEEYAMNLLPVPV